MKAKKRPAERRPPEQVAAEKTRKLVSLLSNDGDVDLALANAQALLVSEPLMVTICISRVTGQITYTTSANEMQERDIRLVANAARIVQQGMSEALVKIAEERGRQEARKNNGSGE